MMIAEVWEFNAAKVVDKFGEFAPQVIPIGYVFWKFEILHDRSEGGKRMA